MLEYVKGNLRFSIKVTFRLNYIGEKEKMLDMLSSISSSTNGYLAKRNTIERHLDGSDLYFRKGAGGYNSYECLQAILWRSG
jgi:hypothetical protein